MSDYNVSESTTEAEAPSEQQSLLSRRLSRVVSANAAVPKPGERPRQHQTSRIPLVRKRSLGLRRQLSIFDIARLTICMLGVQFTWTVELGYGTPYLLSLGIPKTLTPLVWLAGPLSGLVIQPVVGVFSDSLDWKIGRRRPFILVGAMLTILSMYMVAFARDLAEIITGNPDSEANDPYTGAVKAWTIGFAVVGFYCLDFSINAVQASCRSLIMDIPPTDQQEICNAWSGWMNNLGSVVGFFAGNLDLVKYFSPYLGDTQIKILANVAMFFFILCLSICCLSVKEIPYRPTEEDKKRSIWNTLGNIWKALRILPEEIQRICNVQFFAWMGWFPFLFYSTTWVGEILHRYESTPGEGNNDGHTNSTNIIHLLGGLYHHLAPHPPSEPLSPSLLLRSSPSLGGDPETDAERAGSFALLCWAGVAVFCGILIPKITPQEIGFERWPRNPFTLKNLWTMSLVWFAVCMGMTWFVDDLWAATGVIALCGVPWAVAMWIPFAMVGEIISDMKDRLEGRDREEDQSTVVDRANYGTVSSSTTTLENNPKNHNNENISNSNNVIKNDHTNSENNGETSVVTTVVPIHDNNDNNNDDDDDDDNDETDLFGNHGLTDAELEAERKRKGPHLDAGLVLGVHNMYIVFPQFVDAIIASCLFAIIGTAQPRNDYPRQPPSTHQPPPGVGIPPSDASSDSKFRMMSELVKAAAVATAQGGPEPVGWVLRFGGLMALIAAYLTRRL